MTRYRTLFLTERGARHQRDALKSAPPELDVVMLRQPPRAELWPYLADAAFLISERTGAVDAELIAAAPNLKLIVRLGSLAHDIDLEAARVGGVVVCLRPQRGVIMVAEHVVLQMLALVKRLREAEAITLAVGDWGESHRTDENTFAYNWSGRAGIGGLWGATIGILGFGAVGAELARRLRGWECQVYYYRRRRLPSAIETDLGISYAERDTVLAVSDFVVNLLPYFPETDLSIGTDEFAHMKHGAYLVSCGSGGVIDESALADALRRGHLAGSALDTFEWEPIKPDNPLRLLALEDSSANVLLTPHTAAGAPPAGTTPSRSDDYIPIMQFLHGQPVSYRLA